MKNKTFLIGSVLSIALLATACAGQPTVPPEIVETAVDVVNTQVPPGAVETAAEAATQVAPAVLQNVESLVQVLQAAGATVEVADQVEQPFFAVPGQILRVNGEEVQVFVYNTAEAMEADATQVAADGGTIGTSSPSWMGPPHFYKLGQLLVVYVGENQDVMNLLSAVFGPQFAGQ